VSEVVGELVARARCVLGALDPAALSGAAAKQLVEEFAELKRLASAGEMLAAGRVAQTGAWVGEDGAFRDVGAWMAHVGGTSVGRARATIETAERLAALPETAAALRAGALSEVQVDVIASAATADPRAEASLLRSAASDGVKGLKQACARVEAAASTDQAERYERVRVGRYLRLRRISDVEGLIEMRGPIDVTARVMAALGPIEEDLFDEARAADRRELPEALAFDALAQMADDSATVAAASSGRRAPATVVYRVDHTAFTRGATEPGEVCEIVGVGPVPVFVAQKFAGDAILKALITDGTDVLSVSHLGRTIRARVRTAIEERQPECVIAGCHVDRHLEIDHNIPVEERGPTAIWNLNRLCHHHHDLKHANDLRVVGEGMAKRLVPACDASP
jgi:hypothetical protein